MLNRKPKTFCKGQEKKQGCLYRTLFLDRLAKTVSFFFFKFIENEKEFALFVGTVIVLLE